MDEAIDPRAQDVPGGERDGVKDPVLADTGRGAVLNAIGQDRFTIVFFFSSRTRHTRFTGDWSSDVCSSDLSPGNIGEALKVIRPDGVDVSSGVESSPGVKQIGQIIDFCKRVRAADAGQE